MALRLPEPEWVTLPEAVALVAPPLPEADVRQALVRALHEDRLLTRGALLEVDWLGLSDQEMISWSTGDVFIFRRPGEPPFIFVPEIRRQHVLALFDDGQAVPPPARRGRNNGADWDAVKAAIEAECARLGCVPPDNEGPVSWKIQADVERWVAGVLDARGERVGESAIRTHVRTILKDLKARN